jgi:hypothetical protein
MANPTIRSLQPGDLLIGRGRHKRELFLNADGLSAQTRSPTWTTFLPWGASGCGLVYESAAHGSAQVYACVRPRRDKWDVVYLASPADVGDDIVADIWQSLLERLCQEAGRRGVLRVFARLAERDTAAVMDTFRRAGFVVYGHDMLWQREPGAPNSLPPLEPVPATLRLQRGADSWGLHSLYRALAPSLVQQSEGFTSRDWKPPGRRWFGNGPRAYVLTLAGEIKGYLCVSKEANETRLRLLAHPDAHEAVRVLLAAGLAELGIDQTLPLTFVVPEYGSWVVGTLEQAGFRHVGTQPLLVKHTVAWVRAPEPRRRPVMKEILEPAPTVPATPATVNGEPT